MENTIRILPYLEKKTLIVFECGFCGEGDERESTRSIVAMELAKEGWEEISSGEFQVQALACPSCVKDQSKKKSEDER